MEIDGVPIEEGRVYFIAEAGVNHNADLETAEELIEAAAAADADAVKFQTFSADRLVTRNADLAAYQDERVGEESQYEMLQRYELDEGDHKRLMEHASAHDITFLSTPFDVDSARMLADMGVPAIKIGSGDLTNHPLLTTVAELGLPIVLSTGMATMDEVSAAREAICSASTDVPLAFLHCTSAYPCSIDDVNLRAMNTLDETFPESIGFSDHTTYPETPSWAVATGARIVEKHFTLDSTLPGPDHESSLEPDELNRAVRLAKLAVRARGEKEKAPVDEEVEIRRTSRKSLHAARPIEPGRILTEEDIKVVRPVVGLLPADYEWALGRTVNRPIEEEQPIERADIAEE